MKSFELNNQNVEQSFQLTSEQSTFALLSAVPINASSEVIKENLCEVLSGCYVEIRASYTTGQLKKSSLVKAYELKRLVNPIDFTLYFHWIYQNEFSKINGKQVFYDQLTVKLISRFDQETEVGLQLFYEDNGLVKAL
jgi:hypothetical protein